MRVSVNRHKNILKFSKRRIMGHISLPQHIGILALDDLLLGAVKVVLVNKEDRIYKYV